MVATWLGHSTVVLDLDGVRVVAGPLLTASENAAWVDKERLVGRGVVEGEWVAVGEATQVTVRLVPAVHHSRPMPHRSNAANGQVVRGPSGVAWIAGDTDLYAGIPILLVFEGSRRQR